LERAEKTTKEYPGNLARKITELLGVRALLPGPTGRTSLLIGGFSNRLFIEIGHFLTILLVLLRCRAPSLLFDVVFIFLGAVDLTKIDKTDYFTSFYL
jgi:lysophospholipase L1-like esterase